MMTLILVGGLALVAVMGYRRGWFNGTPLVADRKSTLAELMAEIEEEDKKEKAKQKLAELKKTLAPKDGASA